MKLSNINSLSTSFNSTNINNTNSSNSNVNYSLTISQQTLVQNIIATLRTNIDNVISFLAQNINNSTASIVYSNNNFAISFVGVNRDFNFSFFNQSQSYEPYFDMTRCLAYTMQVNINNKSFLLNPLNQFKPNDGMFKDPIYISPNGTVINTTLKSRIDTYYLNTNFSCTYQNTSINNYSSFGMQYMNYSNGYIICQSSHLTDILVTHNYQPANFGVSSPYFYLNYFALTTNYVNYLFI